MADPTEARATDELRRVRERLDELVKVRTTRGFTNIERVEYERLVETEARLL